jgi:curved DNA-binding protein CbpA
MNGSVSNANNPFSLLSLEPSFLIEAAAVERAFLRTVARLHPDHAGNDPVDDGSVAAVTNARDVLLDAERRAGALLELRGGPGPHADRSLPEGFLEHILELRQTIEDELAQGGAAALARWRTWATNRRAEHVSKVTELFTRSGQDATQLAAIRTELNAWRYTERMIEQLVMTTAQGGG